MPSAPAGGERECERDPYGDLGCGAPKLKTPNIDRLAAEGRRSTDARSAPAVCTPSRDALITGRYPFRKGLSSPAFLKTGLVIDEERTSIADVMKDAGYVTAWIGRWHLGFEEETPEWNGAPKPGPLELGFDYCYGVPIVNSHPPFVYVGDHHVVGLVHEDPLVFGKTAKTQVIEETMGIDQMGGAERLPMRSVCSVPRPVRGIWLTAKVSSVPIP